MNLDAEPHDDPFRPDPLEGLLAKAAWPQPDPEVEERLRRQWLMVRTSKSHRDRRVMAGAAVLAAAIVLAAGVALWNGTYRHTREHGGATSAARRRV